MLRFAYIQAILFLGIWSGGEFYPSSVSSSTTALLVTTAEPSDEPMSVTINAHGGLTNVDGDETSLGGEDDDVNDDDDDDDDEDEGVEDRTYNFEDDDDDDDEDENGTYLEFFELDEFQYYPHEFEYGENGTGRVNRSREVLHMGMFILSDFVVAGTNLASYKVRHPPFLLFEDFDISSLVLGNEMWDEMVAYRRRLERPALSWYVDKVARKRWLDLQGYPQPTIYYLKYKDELVPDSPSSTKEEEADIILQNLPTSHGYAAKPTHLSMSMGNWLVDIDPNRGDKGDNIRFTKEATRLTSDEPFDPAVCADSLAEGLRRKAAKIESWALKRVRPGLVVEELFSDHRDRSLPPNEFCMFVIWGRVYAGIWNEVGEGRYFNGIYYRDGRPAPGCPFHEPLPDWVPWDELVTIAESLSAHKDMFRVDMFVGVPRYSPPDALPQIVVSESEIFPTTIFCNPYIADEMARLWVAGYEIGNYKTIDNTEVPVDFIGKSTTA